MQECRKMAQNSGVFTFFKIKIGEKNLFKKNKNFTARFMGRIRGGILQDSAVSNAVL
jgi:hypothetical protein